jgi:membrane-associated protein
MTRGSSGAGRSLERSDGTFPPARTERVEPFGALVDLVSASPWTYAVILAVAALDALVPMVPSETTVISAGVLAGSGELELALVVAVAAAGAYVGDSSAYWLGRGLSDRLGRTLFRSEKAAGRRDWAEGALEGHGGPIILGARFVPGGRTAVTVTAGIVGMRWARFALFAAVAAVAWASYAALIGYLGGRVFEEPLWGLLAGFGVAFGIFAVVEAARRLRSRRRRVLEASRAPA